MQVWRALILLAVMVSPAVIGSFAVSLLPGSMGFVIALVVSMILLREATLICMMLMRHWQVFGRDLFLIEQNGHHRWVDVFELKEIQQPCHIRAQEFYPDFIHQRRRR